MTSYLQQNCLYKSINGRSKGCPVFFIQANTLETPKEYASFTKYTKKV